MSLRIASNQVGADLRHVLCNQTETERTSRIDLALIEEGHRFEREDGFAGFIHWSDLLLETPRGRERPDLVVRIDVNRPAIRDRSIDVADASGVAVTGATRHARTNADIPTAAGQGVARIRAQPDII